ncbi:MAG: Fic/DOC family N-terminal domain-containing protein [Planctomycetota bacterium]
MDAKLFTADRPGELLRIVRDPEEWSFIPNPVSPNWVMDLELEPHLGDAREALGNLNGIGRLLPNPQLLISPLQSREALTSSELEGTIATPQELLLFQLDPTKPTSRQDRRNEYLEVFNCIRAMQAGHRALCDDKPLSLRLIREMHRVLLQDVRGDNARPGEFRDVQVAIGGDRRFVPPPPTHLDKPLNALEARLNDPRRDNDRLALAWAYLLHYQFETIHPFADGNGRIGRVLLSLTTWKWVGLSMPWLYMSPYFNVFKKEYFAHLHRVSTHNDIAGWLRFCFKGTVAQAQDATRRCEALLALKQEFASRLSSTRAPQIIDQLLVYPMLTTSTLAKQIGVAYNTAKSDIEALLEAAIVEPVKDAPHKTYIARDIVRIAYAERFEFPEPEPIQAHQPNDR